MVDVLTDSVKSKIHEPRRHILKDKSTINNTAKQKNKNKNKCKNKKKII